MPIYMRIEGIDGASTGEHRRNWFDVFSFSWGETNMGVRGGGGGGGAGKVNMSDFNIAKPSGKGSPALFLFCANGRHLPAVQIEVTEVRQEEEMVMQRYTLNDCLISSYQTSGDGGGEPVESLSFDFGKITFVQTYFMADGSVRTQTAWWDVLRNQGGGG